MTSHGVLRKSAVTTILLLIALAFCASVLSADGPVIAQPDQVTLELAATGSQVQLTVPQEGGSLVINLIRKGPANIPLTVDLSASPFMGEHGDILKDLKFGIASDTKRPDNSPPLNGIVVNRPILPIKLVVPALSDPGKYSGKLFFSTATRVLLTLDVALTRATAPQPATLVVVPQAAVLEVTKPLLPGVLLPWEAAPSLMLTLRDKSGQWALQQIYAEVEQILKAPKGEFDPQRNAELLFNGSKDMDGFAQELKAVNAQKPDESDIAAGEHATVQVRLLNLQAGEYSVVLRFRAKNSTFDDASQKFSLTVKVRSSWVWATSMLLGALLLSFFGIKLVDFRRKGLGLRQRADEVGAGWLNAEPPIFPVIFARALLRQVRDLSHSWWLSGPDVLDKRLTAVTKLVDILNQVRQVRDEITAAPYGSLFQVRALAVLRRTTESLQYDALDDQTILNAKTNIAALRTWLLPNSLDAAYWAELLSWVRPLLGQVRPEAIPEGKDREWIAALQKEVQDGIATTPSDLNGIQGVESKYARLKILWERRSIPEEFKKLVEIDRSAKDHEALFKAADAAVWNRLGKQSNGNHISVKTSQTEGLEAYQPITFKVSPGDDLLDATYLFQHGLRYEWTFTLKDKKNRERLVFRPVSQEPRVVQYSPLSGSMTASVRIHWRDEALKEASGEACGIGPSSLFAISQGFETMEVVSLGIAIVVAIGTGLGISYFSNATFGSAEDYLKLAAWGFGTDVTKTGLQILQDNSAWKSKA